MPGRAEPTTTPVRSSKVSEVVAAEIVKHIVTNDLRPGDRLPTEAQMLAGFDVGRASIREALRILEVYGLIAIRQGQRGGPVVADLNPADLGRTLSFYFHLTGSTFRELIEARLVIEPVMARLAAEARDPTQMEALRGAMEREATSSLDLYLPCAHEFHYTVSGASGNTVLDLIGRSLRTIYSDRISAGGIFPADARTAVRETHARIGKAILRGEGRQAEKLMAAHMRDLAQLQAERTPWFMDERVSWDG